MLARLHSVTLEGIEGVICEVEVDVARGGLEKSIIVGLPDAAVKESLEQRPPWVHSGASVAVAVRTWQSVRPGFSPRCFRQNSVRKI